MEKLINDKLIQLLNFRIEQEEISSRLYFSMAIWLEYNGFIGAASLWKKYSEEEKKHAEWAYTYQMDMNIKPAIPAIPAPDSEFEGLVDIIEKSLEHEKLVTSQCTDLAAAALKDGDFMVLTLAQKYLAEQQEELAKTQYWVDRLEAFGDECQATMRLLDDEMGEK